MGDLEQRNDLKAKIAEFLAGEVSNARLDLGDLRERAELSSRRRWQVLRRACTAKQREIDTLQLDADCILFGEPKVMAETLDRLIPRYKPTKREWFAQSLVALVMFSNPYARPPAKFFAHPLMLQLRAILREQEAKVAA